MVNEKKTETTLMLLKQSVWNNLFLKRYILSLIKETVPYRKEMMASKRHLDIIASFKRARSNVHGLLFTPLLLASHIEHLIKSSLTAKRYPYLNDISANPILRVDIALFQSVHKMLMDKDLYNSPTASKNIWDHIVGSNNIELYKYARSQFLLPSAAICFDLVLTASKIGTFRSISTVVLYDTIIPISKGSEILEDMLDELPEIFPEDDWSLAVDTKYIVANGRLDLYKKLELERTRWIKYKKSINGFGTLNKLQNNYNIYLSDNAIVTLIINQHKDLFYYLYFNQKIIITERILKMIVNTCLITGVLFLNQAQIDYQNNNNQNNNSCNNNNQNGFLYSMVMYSMSKEFQFHQWRGQRVDKVGAFIKQLEDVARQLNYIDPVQSLKRSTAHKPNGYPILGHYKLKLAPQYFQLLQQQSSDPVPTLSFNFSEDL
ncbi:hypothetical protein DFA_01416 [Cavenderia fasciculata]|uniref:Uncharacterized protein n=1 Tax=Cavenderia fasciculata TaxID=261658 RepID=F4PSQ2_CACFS|nr:uncharacterized protein DFA_01416 [Cavenderia fasciculata]EGG21530.1 hypothetical protein DFA_01416 [Cavenderia fasciculata]|eukprot:XP_004359380.1 hypothetical protein DFA_01416 [Cavenderia fasciculata]